MTRTIQIVDQDIAQSLKNFYMLQIHGRTSLINNIKNTITYSDAPSSEVAGYAFAVVATAIWSFNFIVARILADSVPPVMLAFLRWTIAAAFLLPFGIRPFFRELPIIRKHLFYVTVTAFLLVTVFNTLIYIAAHTSKALNLALIASSSPIFTILLAYFFLNARLGPLRIIGLISATLGVVLLVTRGDLSVLRDLTFSEGELWMVLAAVVFGIYNVLVRIKPTALGSVAFLSSTLFIGLLFLVPWVIWEQRHAGTLNLTMPTLMAIVYLGIGPSLIAFLCWNKAIMLIGPVRSAIAYYSLPIFSAVEGLILLGEPVTFIDFLSGALILIGVIISTRE